jgi:hypothetical protein
MALSQTAEAPKNLVAALEHRPSTRSELLTYVANWKAYADFLLEQAKACQKTADHPLHFEEGRKIFVNEITRFQKTYTQVETDLRTRKLHLHGDEMRRIGGHFSEANLIIEQAIAIHQMV